MSSGPGSYVSPGLANGRKKHTCLIQDDKLVSSAIKAQAQISEEALPDGVTYSPLSLASGVLPEFPPVTTARAALDAGFDAVGLWVEPSGWGPGTTREIRNLLADTIPVLDVEVIWIQPGADNPDHFRVLDIGAQLGARNALVVSSDPDFGATAEKLARLCEHARGTDIRVALEFGLFTEVKSLGDALSIIGRIEQDNVALLIDPLHLSRSGGTPAQLRDVPQRYLSYAQFCDAPADLPDTSDVKAIIHEAIDLRLLPGQGALPLADLLQVLPHHIPLSVELRSKALRDAYPDASERAAALATATRRYLENTSQG